MVRVVQGLNHRLAHHSRGADHAVEPRVSAHLQDGRNAAAFLAEQLRPRIDELDFG